MSWRRRVGAAAALALCALASAGCGDGGEETSTATSDADTVETATSPSTTDDPTVETGTAGPEPDDDAPDRPETGTGGGDGPEGGVPGSSGRISIGEPSPFATVTRTFVLAGTATTTEGALQWELRVGAGEPPVTTGRMTASCGAPCRGQYRTTVRAPRARPGSYELVVWETSAEDGRRLGETFVPVTVVAQRDPGAPPSDTPPPGS